MTELASQPDRRQLQPDFMQGQHPKFLAIKNKIGWDGRDNSPNTSSSYYRTVVSGYQQPANSWSD